MLFYVAAINPVKANPDMRTLLVTTTSKRLYRNRCRQPRWVQAGQAESISGPIFEQLSNVVFWEVELSGDFFLHHTVFEGTSFDHQHDLFMAS